MYHVQRSSAASACFLTLLLLSVEDEAEADDDGVVVLTADAHVLVSLCEAMVNGSCTCASVCHCAISQMATHTQPPWPKQKAERCVTVVVFCRHVMHAASLASQYEAFVDGK